MSSFHYNQKSIHHSTLSQKMQTEQKKFHEFKKESAFYRMPLTTLMHISKIIRSEG